MREQVACKELDVRYVPYEDQLADANKTIAYFSFSGA